MSEPLAYMQRTKAYYEAQGFTTAYRYAQHETAPFAPLSTALSGCRLGLVTTAATYPRAPLEPRKVDRARIHDGLHLHADDLSWDKQATHLDDRNSYCPVDTLQAMVANGHLGGLSEHVHCIPTEYSHKATLQHDAPQIHEALVADGADIALLVPL